MRGAIPPIPQYVFMAWCLSQHGNNFNFYLHLFYFPCIFLFYFPVKRKNGYEIAALSLYIHFHLLNKFSDFH
jgi:hypothetical protein